MAVPEGGGLSPAAGKTCAGRSKVETSSQLPPMIQSEALMEADPTGNSAQATIATKEQGESSISAQLLRFAALLRPRQSAPTAR